jgi:hypothetical protein
MAIARGAGTEIIRSVIVNDINGSSTTNLIYGVRHHIYTVLSVVVYCHTIASTGYSFYLDLLGYDSKTGTAQDTARIWKQPLAAQETAVFNDKFSFNGYEPVDFTGPIDSEAKQDAIADQLVSGDSNRQILRCAGDHSTGDSHDVIVTYIDQNNA